MYMHISYSIALRLISVSIEYELANGVSVRIQEYK